MHFHESNKEKTNKVSSCLSQILRHYQSKRFVLLVLVLAWAVIPQNMKWTLFDGRIVINSWRLFLLISTLLPLIAGVGSAFCHESPRFLMAKGRKDKALRVFQSIYSVNTGNPEHTYSVTLCKIRGTANLTLKSVRQYKILYVHGSKQCSVYNYCMKNYML